MTAIPAIDLADVPADGPFPEPVERAMGEALESIGFFALSGHGVPKALIDDAYAAALRFFDLPPEGRAASVVPGAKGQRGYTGFAEEQAAGADVPDLKEFFQVVRTDGRSAYGPNVWPDAVADFRRGVSELYDRLASLADRIAAACSRHLGLGREFLPERIAGGESILRLIHYPPLADDAPVRAVRAAAHADINFLTLLVGATAGGLEVRDHAGGWVPVVAGHDEIIVDSGDMLQNLTGGLFRSTVHRVVNPPPGSPGARERRLSMPFFVHPRRDVDLSPLPGLEDRGATPGEYRSLTAGEFLDERLAQIRPKGS